MKISAKYRTKAGENGGFILMHSVGALPFNSEGMYRGFQKSDGARFVGIY